MSSCCAHEGGSTLSSLKVIVWVTASFQAVASLSLTALLLVGQPPGYLCPLGGAQGTSECAERPHRARAAGPCLPPSPCAVLAGAGTQASVSHDAQGQALRLPHSPLSPHLMGAARAPWTQP